MYGGGGTPPIAGGIVGGGLVATGVNVAWPIAIVTLSLLIGAALLVRDVYIKRQRHVLV